MFKMLYLFGRVKSTKAVFIAILIATANLEVDTGEIWTLAAPTLEAASGSNPGCVEWALVSGLQRPALNYPSLKFTGKYNSYLDIEIAVGPLDQSTDFSFELFFARDALSAGTLFHYKIDDRVSQLSARFFRELKLFYNDGTMSAVCIDQNGSVVHSVNSPNILNDWNSVAFSYDASAMRLELVVNTVRLDMTRKEKHTLALPGTVRLGGGFDTTMTKYNGSMACLHIQLSQKFGSSDFDNNVNICNSENTMRQPISIAPTPCSRDRGQFKLVAKDITPNASVAPLNVAWDVPSKLRCGHVCMKTDRCVSFTFTTSLRECALYDNDYQTNVVPVPGTFYYVKTND